MSEETTSAENVELVRRVLRRFANEDIDSALGDIDSAATLDWSNSDAPDRGIYEGHAAWRAFVRARDEALRGRRLESVELRAADADSVVVVARIRERGRASGVEVASFGAAVWTLRAGKVIRLKLFRSRAEALEAVGLAA